MPSPKPIESLFFAIDAETSGAMIARLIWFFVFWKILVLFKETSPPKGTLKECKHLFTQNVDRLMNAWKQMRDERSCLNDLCVRGRGGYVQWMESEFVNERSKLLILKQWKSFLWLEKCFWSDHVSNFLDAHTIDRGETQLRLKRLDTPFFISTSAICCKLPPLN